MLVIRDTNIGDSAAKILMILYPWLPLCIVTSEVHHWKFIKQVWQDLTETTRGIVKLADSLKET